MCLCLSQIWNPTIVGFSFNFPVQPHHNCNSHKTNPILSCSVTLRHRSGTQKVSASSPQHQQLSCPKRIDLLTFWFSRFGPFLVMAPTPPPFFHLSFWKGSDSFKRNLPRKEADSFWLMEIHWAETCTDGCETQKPNQNK